MAVWLDPKQLEHIPEHEITWIIKVCQAGIDAALREGNMKAYFMFSIKEESYRCLFWRRMGEVWSHGQFCSRECLGYPVIYPSETDTCVELYERYMYRYPTGGFA